MIKWIIKYCIKVIFIRKKVKKFDKPKKAKNRVFTLFKKFSKGDKMIIIINVVSKKTTRTG